VQECPQPPPGPTSHAGRARTGAPTDRSRSLAIGRAVRGSRPDQCVDHRPCLPVLYSWLHLRQPGRQQPHVAAHSSDHRTGSGPRPRDRGPSAGARHPLPPHFARPGSAGHQWPAARDTSWLTLITSSGRHMMRRSVRQAPSAASTRPPRRIRRSNDGQMILKGPQPDQELGSDAKIPLVRVFGVRDGGVVMRLVRW
jgi:hypothetical protein